MAMTINHNLMAMNTSRNLSDHYGKLGVSTRRLSSGLRVGTAADDAAGLAIRELMRSDIASTNQGIRNANDAISLIQTADGALQIVDEKLIRMKELATQAATGTYTSAQRLIIDSEYQAMASEITRIACATNFNGIPLLNGNLARGFHDGSQLVSRGSLKIHFGTGNSSSEDYYYLSIDNMRSYALGPGLGLGADLGRQAERAGYGAYAISFQFNSYDAAVEDYLNVQNSVALYAQDRRNQYVATNGQSAWDSLDIRERQRLEIQWGKEEVDNIANTGALFSGQLLNGDLAQRMQMGDGAKMYYGSFNGNTVYTQQDAQNALGALDWAIINKDTTRAQLGATQNRLSNTIQNLQIQAENLQASESRISDVDVAQEMTSFVGEQILTQAATAMLAQANSLPKMALQLIQGG